MGSTDFTDCDGQERRNSSLERLCSAARFDRREIVLGRKVGSGRFCDLYDVKSLIPQPSKTSDMCSQWTRDCLAQHARRKNGEARYCVKFIQQKYMASHEGFEAAATHLSMELEWLSSLRHPRIALARAVARQGSEAYYLTGQFDSYFLLMDRMQETLPERLVKWRRQYERSASRRFSFLRRSSTSSKSIMNTRTSTNNNAANSTLAERVKVAYGIAEALDYLHSQRIIHRDLRPCNFGFQKEKASIQLFDFGYAKQLEEGEDSLQDDVSEFLPTHPYLAPEVSWRDVYNPKADVFSFTTLLYELLTLTKFKDFDVRRRAAAVCTVHLESAKTDPAVPLELLELLHRGWSIRASDRPSMSQVCGILRGLAFLLRDGVGSPSEESSSHLIMSSSMSIFAS
jgi:serine/threonine protein kinase